jgi:hypothetical protein
MTDDTQAREGLEGGAAPRPDELEDRLEEIVESGPMDTSDTPGPPRVEMHPGGPMDEMPTKEALAKNTAKPGKEAEGGSQHGE